MRIHADNNMTVDSVHWPLCWKTSSRFESHAAFHEHSPCLPPQLLGGSGNHDSAVSNGRSASKKLSLLYMLLDNRGRGFDAKKTGVCYTRKERFEISDGVG
jgi:hypothetical protein